MSNYHQQPQPQPQLSEGLEYGDLARLLHEELHIDEFTSKMGDDADIIVLSFKLTEKAASEDLMRFIERGYEWVLDADFTTGDFDDGDFLVFVEIDRDKESLARIIELMDDIVNLTDQSLKDWHFQYGKNPKQYELNLENLKAVVPSNPNVYKQKVKPEEDELEAMQEAARVPIKKRAPKNDFTESLRVAAGLK